MRTFEVDIHGRFAEIITAENEQDAYEKACKKHPNVRHSIQVWEIGVSSNGKNDNR